MGDLAGLGRGPLTRWLPVLLLDPDEPRDARPFEVEPGLSPGRFLARVIFSIRRITLPSMLLAVVWQVGEACVPVVMGLAIDRALATGDGGQLALWLGGLAALYVALTVAARFSLRLMAYAVQVLQHRLRCTLSTRVLHPAGGTPDAPDGGVVSLMTNDVSRVANGVILLIIPASRIAAIGFIAFSLLTMYWLLGLVVILGAPVAVWSMGLLSERLSQDTRDYQELLAATVGQATDLVAGYRVIKGVRAEAEATRRYRDASQETLVGARRNAGMLGRFLMTSGMLSGTFVAAVLGLAGWYAVEGVLSVGELIAAVGLTQALLPQMQWIASTSIPNLASARASSARVLGVLLDHAAVPQRDAPAPPTGQPPTLDVVVGPEGSGGLVTIAPGELVGVRADDLTAARIVDALLDPRASARVDVLLDGTGAGGLSPQRYRSVVTVAPHRAMLFSGSLRENLLAERLDDEQLEAVLRAAACDDFAADLDAPVGEGGNRLSGGQRQRVALARALAADAPVLVLHDPTTAVDSVTEHAIAGRLRGVRAGRSTLLLTSAPALLAACDRVVEL